MVFPRSSLLSREQKLVILSLMLFCNSSDRTVILFFWNCDCRKDTAICYRNWNIHLTVNLF